MPEKRRPKQPPRRGGSSSRQKRKQKPDIEMFEAEDLVEIEDISSSDNEWEEILDDDEQWIYKMRSKRTQNLYHIKAEVPPDTSIWREVFAKKFPPIIPDIPTTIHNNGIWDEKGRLERGFSHMDDYQGGEKLHFPKWSLNYILLLEIQTEIYLSLPESSRTLVEWVEFPILIVDGVKMDATNDADLLDLCLMQIVHYGNVNIVQEYILKPLVVTSSPLPGEVVMPTPGNVNVGVDYSSDDVPSVGDSASGGMFDEGDDSGDSGIKRKKKGQEVMPEKVNINDLPEERLDGVVEDEGDDSGDSGMKRKKKGKQVMLEKVNINDLPEERLDGFVEDEAETEEGDGGVMEPEAQTKEGHGVYVVQNNIYATNSCIPIAAKL